MLSEIVMDDVRAKTRKEELKALPKKERKRLLLAAAAKVEEKIAWLKDEANTSEAAGGDKCRKHNISGRPEASAGATRQGEPEERRAPLITLIIHESYILVGSSPTINH